MKKLAVVLAVATLIVVAHAGTYEDLGYREDTVMHPAQGDDCISVLYENHDGSCENAYCYAWGYEPPYFGAFAEAYDLGPGIVECGAYWFTQIGYFTGEPMDCYVWEGGVTTDPGDVVCLITGVVPDNVPYWPDCGQNDVELGCCVEGEFTVGFWADFSDQACQWYICADINGPGGYPWTCVAPGIGYPTGWNHVEVVFGPTASLCLGVYFAEDPSPAESQTWGSIKALFE